MDLAPMPIEPLAPVGLGIPRLAAQELVVVGAEVEPGAVVADGVQRLLDARPGLEDAA